MAGRRGNNEGTYTKRADGRWEARLTLPDGTRKSFYAKTQREVQQKLKQAQRDVDAGLPLVDERQTVAQYLAAWLDIVKARVDESSFRRYRDYVRVLLPFIGSHSLAKLLPQHIQQCYATLLEQGSQPGTIARMHGMLHASLKKAQRLGLVQRNVSELVDPPRKIHKEMQVLSEAQVQTFLSGVVGNRYEALYILVLSTGLRAGEVFALQWRDVDFDNRRLSVRLGWQFTDAGYVMTLPKTPHAVRTIALSQTAIDALLVYRDRQQKERDLALDMWDTTYDLVFSNHVGKRLGFKNFSTRVLHPKLHNLGLPEIRFHDLRHTAATLLLSRGVNVKVVSEMLGHANVSITLEIYSHVLPHMQEEAARVMDDILKKH